VKIEILINEAAVVRAAAELLAGEVRAAVAQRGRCVLALSGGRTPWSMFKTLAKLEVPWQHLQIVQVDERVAPLGDPDRNLTHLHESLLAHAPLRPEQIHTMAVEAPDLGEAAAQYARTLQELAESPAIIDIIHLGLGPDGHTASLVPGDPALDVSNFDVAVTGIYQGRRRMTLTYPVINRARRILWVVTGLEKAAPLAQLRNGDPSVPAGRVSHNHAIVIADRAAAAGLEAN
jgi:6-phosphogluconolactonase